MYRSHGVAAKYSPISPVPTKPVTRSKTIFFKLDFENDEALKLRAPRQVSCPNRGVMDCSHADDHSAPLQIKRDVAAIPDHSDSLPFCAVSTRLTENRSDPPGLRLRFRIKPGTSEA
jgi:hypothetical protein